MPWLQDDPSLSDSSLPRNHLKVGFVSFCVTLLLSEYPVMLLLSLLVKGHIVLLYFVTSLAATQSVDI
jgi:hypothetical protein